MILVLNYSSCYNCHVLNMAWYYASFSFWGILLNKHCFVKMYKTGLYWNLDLRKWWSHLKTEQFCVWGLCLYRESLWENIKGCPFLLVVFLCCTRYYLLDVDRNHMLNLVDLCSIKCNFFTVLGRLDLSKALFFRLMAILHMDSYDQSAELQIFEIPTVCRSYWC